MLKHTNQLCFNPYLFTMYSIAWSIAMPMYILCLSMLCPCITYANHISCLCIAMLTICYTYACALLMLWVLYIYYAYAYTLSMLSIAYHSYTLCIIVYRCSLSSCSYAINAIYTYNAIIVPAEHISMPYVATLLHAACTAVSLCSYAILYVAMLSTLRRRCALPDLCYSLITLLIRRHAHALLLPTHISWKKNMKFSSK